MKNLDVEKYEKAFEKTLKLISNREKLYLYDKINRIIQSHIALNRVSALSFPFEKITYQKIILKKSYTNIKIRYHGILESNDIYYMFNFYSKKILSSNDIYECAKINKQIFKKTEVTKRIKSSKEIILSNIISELTGSLYLFNKEEEAVISKEIHYFYKKHITHLFNNNKTEIIFFRNINKKLSKEEVKYAYKLSGKNLSFGNDIHRLFKQNKKDYVVDLLENYPLLFPLFAKELNLSDHEYKLIKSFQENQDKNISLIENVKKHFMLTDLEMETIKKTSWQKMPVLKNRPIILIDLIKKGFRTNEVKTRKEAYSAYLFYYYLECNNRFEFSNVDYNKIKDLGITKKVISEVKSMTNNISQNEKEHRLFINSSFIKKINIKDPVNFILKIRQLKSSYLFLKESFKLDGNEFKLKEKSDCFLKLIYTVKDEEYLIEIKNIDSKSIYVKTKKTKNKGKKDYSNELIELINLEYSRLSNKRYKELSLIDRKSLLLFSSDWFERNTEDLIYYFYIFNFTQYKKTNRFCEYTYKDYNKYLTDEVVESVSLLDII